MIRFLIIILFIIFNSKNLLASDGFYVGVDAAKNDEKVGKIDNSVAQEKVEEDRYYGYKLSGGGFFVAPEVSVEKGKNNSTYNSSHSNQTTELNQTNISKTNPNYDLKANIGYDFNKNVSGFLTYDVAKFSYNSNQGAAGINASSALGNSSVGIGSQINFSSGFGVKVQYGQQKFDSNTASGGQVRSDIVKVGTVYNF